MIRPQWRNSDTARTCFLLRLLRPVERDNGLIRKAVIVERDKPIARSPLQGGQCLNDPL